MVAYSCLSGFGRFRCFCGSCFCFSFVQVLFWFVLALGLLCCWIVAGVVLVRICFFVFFFVFIVFGPPHLALNPPFLFFCVLFVCVFLVFVEGLRVR